MGCGKDLSCILITEVCKTCIFFPARRHRSVFIFGITAEKNGTAGKQSEEHAMVHRLQTHLCHSNE